MNKLLSKQSSNLVEQWANSLPLSSSLSSLLPPTIENVANLTLEQIDEICNIFSTDLKETLQTSCSLLKTVLAKDTGWESNGKFGVYEGNFGTIANFHTQLYEEVGNPNPHWEVAMHAEHQGNNDMFTAGNYGLTTCPRNEWDYVVEGVSPPAEAMGHGRVLQSIDSLMALEVASQAALTRAEVIALVLYTGPMFVIYNTILRKYPTDRYGALKEKDSMFPTSIFVLVSAIQKVSRVMVLHPGQSLYRGVDGNMTLPAHFTTPDLHGCLGMMELGFMSTTTDINVAVSYSGVGKGRAHPKVLEIRIGSVDRGADIHEFSQYPGEAEYLWAPHAFLEPVGGNEMLVTEHGVVEVIKVRANSNLKAVTLDEYEVRKKDMHMASFKMLLQDLVHELDEHLTKDNLKNIIFRDDAGLERNIGDHDKAKELRSSILFQCGEIRDRHAGLAGPDFNDDTTYRSLVTEMLDVKMHSLVKMEQLLSFKEVTPFRLKKPLKMAFRDHMGQLTRKLKQNPTSESALNGLKIDVPDIVVALLGKLKHDPNAASALNYCKKFGLLVKDVNEVNDLGETPLIAASADGVTDDKFELLLMAGSPVNARISYPGGLRKGVTALLTASLYGRTSMVQMLINYGADINAMCEDGLSALWAAAYYDRAACVDLLIKHGADIERPTSNGDTPFFAAAMTGHLTCVELLHEAGANINKANNEGATPLQAAVEGGHNSTVEALLAMGAHASIGGDGTMSSEAAQARAHITVVAMDLLRAVGLSKQN